MMYVEILVLYKIRFNNSIIANGKKFNII